MLQKGDKFETLYIAEGPETAASIAMANPKATVLVSFGVYNMQNLGKIITKYSPKEIIIAGDNDSNPKSETYEITINAQRVLEKNGIPTSVKIPNRIDGLEKTDWNDVLKAQGISEIKRQLEIKDNLEGLPQVSQKALGNLFGKNIDILTVNSRANINDKLNNNYALIRSAQDDLAKQVDKEIHAKIINNQKDKIPSVGLHNINKSSIKEKDLNLEI